MPTSFFDLQFYEFTCESAECRNQFKKILRNLVQADKVVCPYCARVMDIRQAKRNGELRKAFDTAQQLDAKAVMKKG